MDPKIAAFVHRFIKVRDKSINLPLNEQRKISSNLFTPPASSLEPVAKVLNKTITGPDQNPLPIRIIIPEGKGPFPVFLYFHGGGWAFGGVDQIEFLCRKIANRAKCIVIGVDYRLSPENKFPKPLEDCYTATVWAAEHASEFSGDPARIAVGGDSAGGNLAAAVSLTAAENKRPKIYCQILIYPVVTLNFDQQTYHDSPDKEFLTIDSMSWFKEMYLSKPEDANSPFASIIRAQNLADQPPTLILTAELDPLRKENEQYAQRLKEAGVSVKLISFPNVTHGFFTFPIPNLAQTNKAVDDIANALNFLPQSHRDTE